jgi:phosphonoacetate hydrolase
MAMIDETYRPTTDDHLEATRAAEAALLDPSMAHIVDLVLRTDPDGDGDAYEAAAANGRVRFRRTNDEATGGWTFEVTGVDGTNPLADQAIDRFSPLADELAHPHPDRDTTSYPFAYEQVAQLFDAPAAPDLVSIHTAAHNWADQGGHLGEHGSIGVIQARAPFILAGAGAAARGLVAEGCRLVDIAPTVLQLMGCAPGKGVGLNGLPRGDVYLARQDGEPQTQMIDASAAPPEHVVGFLLDGANANVLYDMAARGEAPNVARLLAMGTAMGFGAMSSLPTVTLANHTSILTGAYPGHHGILNNAWYDRAKGQQIITNSPLHWVGAMQHLTPGVESMYGAVARNFPGAPTVSINEPCDVAADYSIFDLMRRGESIDRPPAVEEIPHVTERFVRPVKEYKWSSLIDHTAVEQFTGIWSGSYRGDEWALPRFTWVNFSLTDAAFHEGGPYSEIAAAAVHDTDARIGEVLAAVERAGVFDRAAFFLTADHGMEQSDPGCTGNWAEALDQSGIPYRDEGYSFIYVNP